MVEGRTNAKKDEDVLPAMFEHCVRTYREMLSEAHGVGDVIVYEGYLTTLVTQKVNLSVPYYGRIRTLLIDMGCVRQLKRGGGTAPSQWELITEPTEEAFRRCYSAVQTTGVTRLGKTNERVAALEREISQLKTQVADINQFLADQFGTEEV
jgi:hypothetical protein